MNQLTEFLVNSILEEDKNEIIGIYGGGFKPPIKGHLEVLQGALDKYPEMDKVIVSVGSGVRDKIDQEESLLVWDIYQRKLPIKVEIGASKSGMPIKDIYKLAKENPDKTIYWIIGAREGREDDLQDITKRTAAIDKAEDKYNNVEVKVIKTADPNVSGTNARKALLAGDKEKFFTYLPSFVTDEEKEEIYTILRPAVKEGKDPKKGTGKKPKGSSRRLYTDEDPSDTVKVKFSTRQDIIDTLNKKSFKAKSHARQSQIINLIHQRVRAAYNRAKDPDVKKRLKTALDYAEQRKEASKKKTQRLKKQKTNENLGTESQPKMSFEEKLDYYKDYYINVSPSTFDIVTEDGTIVIGGLDKPYPSDFDDTKDTRQVPVNENVPDAKDDGKAAPYGSAYEPVDEGDTIEKYSAKGKKTGKLKQGTVRKRLNIPKDEKIPMYKINKELSRLKKMDKDKDKKGVQLGDKNQKYYKALQLAKTLKSTTHVNENASYSSEINILQKIDQLTQHMLDKGYNIEPLPALEFVDGDTENARDFFGKTAYYDPNTQTIVLYTEGRHPKDIVRSYAHEMIHHIQNLEGRLGNITTTNTQEDDHLNDIEAEANLKGTMTFRNWTDSLNEIGDASAAKLEWNPDRIEVIAKEIERKIAKQEDDTVEYYDMLPVISVISPESKTRYRVTVDASVDKPMFLPDFQKPKAITTLRVDFTTEEAGDDIINKGEQYKILATLTDIIIQLINRVNDIDSTTLDLVKFYAKDDVEGKYPNSNSKRGKLYQAFINKNLSKLPGNWKMSTSDEVIMLSPVVNEGFDKKLGKDPFGLNAFAYELARLGEEDLLNEGRYDKFVNQLSRIAFETIKDGFESGRKVLDVIFTVRPEEDEPDIESDMFEFDFRVVADYTEDKYKVDGGANEGVDDDGNEITPLLIVNFGIPKNPKWSTVSMDLKDVVRHELEHLTQSGDNVVGVVRDPDNPELNRPGKQMADDKFIRDMIDADMLPKSDYFKLEKEIDAMMQGLYFKAKKSRRPFKDVIDDYLATQSISKEEKEVILNLWRSRNKALNLPVFENEEKVMDYKIFLDMDGVLVNFDQQFQELTGMMPREFESKHSTNEFWEKIDGAGVGFWRGMKWMPGGEELYKRAAQYDHALLSSPSRSEVSKIGKRLWRRDKTPDTKLILARSYNKKKYAAPNHILIDDREDNIQQWKDAGGIGILYKSPEQVNAELDKLGL